MSTISTATDPAPVSSGGLLEHLPSLLRGAGILAFLVSLYGFFLKGWEGSDDLMRFFLLFGNTLTLAGVGLLSGHFLKEGKGARILLMLSLISVIANFSILGSFLYAEFGGALSQNFVSAMRWNIDSPWLAVLLAVVVPLMLIPIVTIGFRVLARGMSDKMTTLFLISNAVLLLPMRNPALVSVLGIMLAAYTLVLVIKNHRQRLEAKTLEGKFALLIQFVPACVLLVRNMWLYDDASMLYASACIVGFVALRQFALMLTDTALLRTVAEILSALLSLSLGAFLIDVIDNLHISSTIQLSLPAMIASGLLYELSTRSTTFERTYRNAAVATASLGVLLNMLAEPGSLTTLITIATGAAMMFYSYIIKHRTMLFAALILLLGATTNLTWGLWFAFNISGWVMFAALAVLAIVAGSMLESKGELLKQKLIQYRATFAQWTY